MTNDEAKNKCMTCDHRFKTVRKNKVYVCRKCGKVEYKTKG